jgi:hypothetical protein
MTQMMNPTPDETAAVALPSIESPRHEDACTTRLCSKTFPASDPIRPPSRLDIRAGKKSGYGKHALAAACDVAPTLPTLGAVVVTLTACGRRPRRLRGN